MSHVDVKKLKPSSFEQEYYDQYDYYNLSDKYAGDSSGRQVRAEPPLPLPHRALLHRGLGPERQDQEGGERQHQPAQPVRT